MSVPRRYRNVAELPSVIPVFPLTGALLLPRARLPLNIFEPRYLAMVDAAMAGARVIGMIQPKTPGADMAPRPDLANVGCAGRIVEYAETDDGRYLITLLGVVRFRVRLERQDPSPYRQVVADFSAFASDFDSGKDPEIARAKLIATLKPYLRERDMKTDWQSIEEAPAETLVNALCMICPFDPAEKQALLEARGLRERAETLIALLELANASAPPAGSGGTPIN